MWSNIRIVFLTSVISNINLLIPSLERRGQPIPSSSVASLSFPAFTAYRKVAMPYFIALAQHSLIGDYLTEEGVQLLWPITSDWYGLGISTTGPTIILLEWGFFITFLTVIFKTKDAWSYSNTTRQACSSPYQSSRAKAS